MTDKWATKVVNYTNKFPWKVRKIIYERIGLISRGGYDIRKGVYFDHIRSVMFGKNIMINQNVQFHTGDSASARICLSDNVFVGMNVCFICVNHVIGDSKQRAGKNVYSDINVGTGVWIGANVTVLPGVTIGSGCVIAAGSVVTSDCEDNCLYAGNPARKKRLLEE